MQAVTVQSRDPKLEVPLGRTLIESILEGKSGS